MSIRGETLQSGGVARLLSSYRTVGGVPDELLGPDGEVRPVWHSMLDFIAAMQPGELKSRMAHADQYLSDAGVYYRHYGHDGAAERDWPLSHMPVLMSEREWEGIATALVHRAELLEMLVADLYGDNRMVREGHLPASLVAGNPEWLRPLVGVRPRSGNYLHFVAFDIGRGPQGQWWVLSDRTQAPSGAGFALENRIATSRMFSESHMRANVHRLAGFFRTFRDTMLDLRESDNSRAGILSPGPLNDTYYEHAYIARYLGFMLLEGEDLTVHGEKLMVRTVAGLQPVSVLWRRLDAAWVDPLELQEASRIGTPGMLAAVRAGNVTMVNALGTGILETRAFLAFLPRISELLTGQPLGLPSIATWWCGQPREREYVKANASGMVIGNAFMTGFPFDSSGISSIAGKFTRPMDQPLESWIEANAEYLVGQEAATLSTTPAFEGETLAPRPMSLRVFLARGSDGWKVMPGGFARIGSTGEITALAMQQGGSAADVWIVSDKTVAYETMLAPASAPFIRQQPSVLPSRAADNLYWLGRYVERAENLIRLLRSYHIRLAEAPSSESPILDYIAEYLRDLESDPDPGFPAGVVSTLDYAATSAGHVRDNFSVDGWMALDDLSKTVRKLRVTAKAGDDMARAMGVLLRKLSGFSGLVHENMYRYTGWRFLSIGRSLERAVSLSSLLATFCDDEAPDGALDLAIEVADSVMSHRRRYAVATNRATVVDLLALDALNPRSVIYQINEIMAHAAALPGGEASQQLSPLQRSILQVHAALALHTPDTLTSPELFRLGEETGAISTQLSATYLR